MGARGLESMEVGEEVADAIAERRAVVALESTVIAHGLPRPRNLEAAHELESVVRSAGAVPATIAVVGGVARIGLSAAHIGEIATAERVEKLSTRELPVAYARGATGATTVAATAHLAARAGIPVFATGGIGGVHRGSPPDVSADLPQLQRTPILVVCAGAKSILDLAATRELLETLGILVLGFRTDVFPEFYTRGRDLTVDARVDSPGEVASIWSRHRCAGIDSAILLCAPIPSAAEIDGERIDSVIAAALADASDAGIRGKAVTPYLLARLATVTDGASTEANVALLRNNAAVAASVAVEIAGLPS